LLFDDSFVAMRRCVSRLSAQRALDYQGASSVWKDVLKNEHVQTVSKWKKFGDDQVAQHLVGVAALSPWWQVVEQACPLVVSPLAESFTCAVRSHLTRLLALNPAALPVGSRAALLGMARALRAQAQRSEHAYPVEADELTMARMLPSQMQPEHAALATELGRMDRESRLLREATGWQEVATVLQSAWPLAPDSDTGSDDPSSVVQQFYERNVFPQWADLVPWERKELLAEPIRRAGEAGRNVLVAGCGTGRWACHFAASFPEARVLAVDVSSASLAFAEERRQHHGLTNIRFEQADLRSWQPAEEFDFIECGGVLHHLEDPEKAWASLAATLRPEGIMLVSLYSRMARRPLKRLRDAIVQDAFPDQWGKGSNAVLDDTELRHFRRALLERIWTNDDMLPYAMSPDLHSMARLRDTLFHPLEHEYTLLNIQAMLDRLELRATGFDADARLLDLFREVCPKRALHDLGAWHTLEQKVPEVFIGMYELFVTKSKA